MKCPECNSNLIIANNKFETEDGEIFSVLTMVCVNSRVDPVKKTHVCSLYAGPNLNEPLKVAAVVKNKVG